jgi:hypothetical protein
LNSDTSRHSIFQGPKEERKIEKKKIEKETAVVTRDARVFCLFVLTLRFCFFEEKRNAKKDISILF